MELIAATVRDLFRFLREQKRWWLIPIVVVLVLVAILLIVGGGPMSPFIYTLF